MTAYDPSTPGAAADARNRRRRFFLPHAGLPGFASQPAPQPQSQVEPSAPPLAALDHAVAGQDEHHFGLTKRVAGDQRPAFIAGPGGEEGFQEGRALGPVEQFLPHHYGPGDARDRGVIDLPLVPVAGPKVEPIPLPYKFPEPGDREGGYAQPLPDFPPRAEEVRQTREHLVRLAGQTLPFGKRPAADQGLTAEDYFAWLAARRRSLRGPAHDEPAPARDRPITYPYKVDYRTSTLDDIAHARQKFAEYKPARAWPPLVHYAGHDPRRLDRERVIADGLPSWEDIQRDDPESGLKLDNLTKWVPPQYRVEILGLPGHERLHPLDPKVGLIFADLMARQRPETLTRGAVRYIHDVAITAVNNQRERQGKPPLTPEEARDVLHALAHPDWPVPDAKGIDPGMLPIDAEGNVPIPTDGSGNGPSTMKLEDLIGRGTQFHDQSNHANARPQADYRGPPVRLEDIDPKLAELHAIASTPAPTLRDANAKVPPTQGAMARNSGTPSNPYDASTVPTTPPPPASATSHSGGVDTSANEAPRSMRPATSANPDDAGTTIPPSMAAGTGVATSLSDAAPSVSQTQSQIAAGSDTDFGQLTSRSFGPSSSARAALSDLPRQTTGMQGKEDAKYNPFKEPGPLASPVAQWGSPLDAAKRLADQSDSPFEVARAIRKYHESMDAVARGKADPRYWDGMIRVDNDTDAVLQRLRIAAQQEVIEQMLPDEAGRREFAAILGSQLEKGRVAPSEMKPRYAAVMHRLQQTLQDPAFNVANEHYHLGLVKVGDTPLARYATRLGSDGVLDVKLILKDGEATIRIPQPTRGELGAEIEKSLAEAAEARKALDRIQKNQQSVMHSVIQFFDSEGMGAAAELLETWENTAKMQAAEERTQGLQQGGIAYLVGERVREELKKPEWRDRVGDYGGWTELLKGLGHVVLDTGAAYARVFGPENLPNPLGGVLHDWFDLPQDVPRSRAWRRSAMAWTPLLKAAPGGGWRAACGMTPS